jgi:hypothetical protein
MSTIVMSEEQEEDLKGKLQSLDLIVKLGWALIAGAFGLGVWVATIEQRVSYLTGAEAVQQQKTHRLEINESATAEKINNALKILERIDRKLNP